MSAFIIGNEHITAMLQITAPQYPGDGSSYYYNGAAFPFGGHSTEIGQKLVDENYRSVNYRYDEDSQPHEFKYTPRRSFTPVEIVKLCDCYNYQTCETPDYKHTEAWAIVNALRERAIHRLAGYDDAPWGFEC